MSAPISKGLLAGTTPLMLAALLYLGGGIGLTAWRFGTRRAQPTEAPLRRGDLPFLAGIVLLGGALGPVLMLWGLNRLTGLATSLLLNLEGPFTVLIALLIGESLPTPRIAGSALALGAAAYRASILLDAHALRLLGAAREAALFATAPFIGALLAIPLLHERPTGWGGAALVLMASGVAQLLRDRHAHRHTHEPLVHEHLHVHDAHHTHTHEGPVDEPHSHVHEHEPLTQDHPHVSDPHHRHVHRPDDAEGPHGR